MKNKKKWKKYIKILQDSKIRRQTLLSIDNPLMPLFFLWIKNTIFGDKTETWSILLFSVAKLWLYTCPKVFSIIIIISSSSSSLSLYSSSSSWPWSWSSFIIVSRRAERLHYKVMSTGRFYAVFSAPLFSAPSSSYSSKSWWWWWWWTSSSPEHLIELHLTSSSSSWLPPSLSLSSLLSTTWW